MSSKQIREKIDILSLRDHGEVTEYGKQIVLTVSTKLPWSFFMEVLPIEI